MTRHAAGRAHRKGAQRDRPQDRRGNKPEKIILFGSYDGLSALDAQGHPLAGSVTLPIVRGLHAFSNGAYDETVRQLAPVMGEVVRIGGSHAQREVIEDTLLQAYLRTERFDAAEALLRTRLGRRETARDHFWIGRAQAATGQTDLAATSFAAARNGWPDADPAAPEIVMLTRALGTLR